jgi:hypothetical protein
LKKSDAVVVPRTHQLVFVKVLPKDIKRGIPGDEFENPIALAVNRKLNSLYKVSVTVIGTNLYYKHERVPNSMQMAATLDTQNRVTAWLYEYSMGTVKMPFTFEVALPIEYLKDKNG